MIQLGTLTKMIKPYSKNKSISNEELLNGLLEPFVSATAVKNRYGEEFHLDKARTSRILNRKEDVPVELRKELERYGVEAKTENGMQAFIEDYIDSYQIEDLRREIFCFIENEEGKRNVTTKEVDTGESLSSLLAKLLIIAISTNNKVDPETMIIWKRGANLTEVLSGDLFKFGFENRSKTKNILVIPVNTAFDTHVTKNLETEDYPLVSENTLHGQWIIRMTKCNADWHDINVRIEDSLRRLGFKPKTTETKSTGKRKLYPKGSIAIVETEKAAFFLTAIAEFNEQNNAGCCPEDIEHAMDVLIEIYDKYGQGYDLYLPLMGTGRSRSGLSMQAAYKLITRKFAENQNRIHGRVHLVIRPEDRNDIIEEV